MVDDLGAEGVYAAGIAISANRSPARSGRSRSGAAASTGASADGSPPRSQPGGQVIERPPSTCRWAWKTVWWACAPVLNTIR